MEDLNGWLALYAGPVVLALAVLLLALSVTALLLVLRVRRLERHYRALTTGTNGGNLEAVLEAHISEVHKTANAVARLNTVVRQLEQDGCLHIQHLGITRFNPFRETGGDQSFVLALVDGRGHGAVISTLHSRDVTRIYAKPLNDWQSTYPLTNEEQQAIRQARDEQGGQTGRQRER